MAINLRATAHLNTGPFAKSLSDISKMMSGLSAQTVAGTKAVSKAEETRATQNRQRAKEYLREHRMQEQSMGRVARATQRAKFMAEDFAVAQRENARLTRQVAEAYRTMPISQARVAEAGMRNTNARRELDRARAYGLDGADLERYEAQARRSYERMAKANAAYEASKTRAAARGAAERNRIRNTETVRAAESRLNRAAANSAAEYTRSLQGMTTAQLSMAKSTANLQSKQAALSKALARGTGIEAARGALASATLQHRKLAESMDTAQKASTSLGTGLAAQRYMYHDISRQMGRMALGLSAFPLLSYGFAIAWERNFVDVIRTADPEFSTATHRVEALRSSIVGMAQSMPVAFRDLTEIATLANQMGIASEQTAEFTRSVAMFAATSGVSVDTVATAFGRLTSIMGDSRIGFMEMADSILKVGVNSVATEEEIINITTQISSIAQQAGFGAKDIIGLSGALASVRVPPELSRGVITRVFGQIDKAVNQGGTGLQTLARLSGTSAEQFRKDWGSEGSASMFNNFLKGLRDAGSAARSEINSLGITSVRDVPVLLRIANAADSEGRVGELLTQTTQDAHNAAGETQRQYTFMAETVIGKLKILGNNLAAFFDAAGRSGLGSFGNMIDKITSSIRKFTNSLDEPNKLLGMFGQTNADVLGLVMNVTLAGAAFMALGSIVAKTFSSIAAFRQLGNVLNVGGIFGGAKGMKSLAGAPTVIGNFGKAATTGATSASRFGTALAGIGRFAWPAAIVGGGLMVINHLNKRMEEGATVASDLAESLTTIDPSNIKELDVVFSNMVAAGPAKFGGFDKNHNPFADGVESFRASIEEISSLREQSLKNFGGWQWGADLGNWVDFSFKGKWGDIAQMEQFNEALQQMVDSGNSSKAIQTLKSLGRAGVDVADMLSQPEFKDANNILKNMFDLADIEYTSANIDKFVKGQLPQLEEALYGVKNAGINADELFEGDFDRLAEFAQSVDEASNAFMNLGSAIEEATQKNKDGDITGFDLTEFNNQLKSQIELQSAWQDDLLYLANHVSPEVGRALADLGPEGAHMVKELAASIRAGGAEGAEALKYLEQVYGEGIESFGYEFADRLAQVEWLEGFNLSEDMQAKLLDSFDGIDIERLRTAGEGVGREVMDGVLEELANADPAKAGEALDKAIRDLELSKPEVEIDPTFKDDAIDKGLAGINAKFKSLDPFKITSEIDADTSFNDFKAMLDDPALNEITVHGNMSLTEAYASSREFQVWAQDQGIDMMLGLDDTPAKVSLATMVALGNGTVTTMELQALKDPAEGAVWEVVQLADGSTGFVQIDADGHLAMNELAIIDDKTGQTRVIPMDADTAKAVAKNLAFRADATKPATVPIDGNDANVRAAIARNTGVVGTAYIDIVPRDAGGSRIAQGLGGGGGITQADGGVVEYYGRGGVRESHVAQIAPAGAWRVWAEPETGGEAYIPLARSKRARSEAILADVADRFGLALMSQNAVKYANGGFYDSQRFSRQSYASYDMQRGVNDAKVSIGAVNFNQENQKDQFRELQRSVRRIARGL